MLKLLLATIKQVLRDKEALFWALVFPAMFILIFSFFKVGGSIDANILVIDSVDNTASKTLVNTIQQIDGIGISTEIGDKEKAQEILQKSEEKNFKYINKDEENKEEIKEERTNLVMVITQQKDEQGNNLPDKFDIEILYNASDETQASPSGILISTIREMTNQQIMASSGITNPFNIERTGVSVNEIKYYDILVPGIIGMGIMQSGVIGMASTIATLKEKRVLKRLSATPLPIWQFLLSYVLTHLFLSVIQVTIMIILAKFVLGANIYGSILLMYFLSFIGNFVFLNLGFIAAAFSKTARASESLSQVFTMPMMFLSGVFFERNGLPEAVKLVADYLPLSPLLDALRAVSLESKGIQDISSELLMILVWTLVSFAIAAKTFKFREE